MEILFICIGAIIATIAINVLLNQFTFWRMKRHHRRKWKQREWND